MSIILTKELLTTQAEEVAKTISGDKKTSNSQIRKFFDDFVLLQSKCKMESEEYFMTNTLPLIAFSKAKMAYSVGRKVLTREFMDQIVSKIDQIETKKDFDIFMLFYQAVIGYSKLHELDKSNSNQSRSINNFNKPFVYKK